LIARAASAGDIAVSVFDNNWADGIHGHQLVGQGSGVATGERAQAVAWDLKAATIRVLNGSGYEEFGAVAMTGTQRSLQPPPTRPPTEPRPGATRSQRRPIPQVGLRY
jgi:hypothetical protein